MEYNANKHITARTRNRRASGISWRLFGALAVFTVLILVSIWVFQVVLLKFFYGKSKLDEFYYAETEISAVIDNDQELRKAVFTN